ncbi:DNA repair protein RAD5 [Cyphellophora attinorum]|uniref:DNA repair protein RAD5 n=1 Tax=Cyphellophora attinorum TaxID=1664694 RepID=A0A0N0NJ10_9EURO|nr:DNA repair protein RAD5 [Phialophora attinorum]KPI36069.1 DNA repair protein RAD5 [Phialophora attinorum]
MDDCGDDGAAAKQRGSALPEVPTKSPTPQALTVEDLHHESMDPLTADNQEPLRSVEAQPEPAQASEHSSPKPPTEPPSDNNVPQIEQSNPPTKSSPIPSDIIEISDDEGDGENTAGAGPSTSVPPIQRTIVKKEPVPEREILETPQGSAEREIQPQRLPSLPIAESIEGIDFHATEDHGPPNIEDHGMHNGEDDEMNDAEMEQLLAEFTRNTEAMPANPQPDDLADIGDHMELDSDAEDARKKEEFKKAKRTYERRKKAGKLDMPARIAFLQAEAAEKARLNARKGKQAYREEEHSMFVSEHEDSPSDDEHGFEMLDDDILEMGPTRSVAESNLESGHMQIAPADENGAANDIDEGAQGMPAKRGRGRPRVSTHKAKATAPPTASVRGKGRGGRPRGSRTTARGRGGRKQPDRSLFQGVDSLLPYDLLGQATKNREAEAQPTSNQTRRHLALAELIASIPQEHRDQHVGDKKLLELAIKSFNGRGAMRADGEGAWRLRGMRTSLHHYQTIGAGKMRERENEGKPSGGMLSDEMGLGKTVMAIANIVDGRAPLESTHKATLIVTPAVLQQQWFNELNKHGDPKHGYLRSVMIYKASQAVAIQNPIEMLSAFDVVITSYHEIVKSYPKKEYPKHLITARAKEEWWEKHFEENKGLLHRIKWHRIVLDEAQAIKNYTSRTSEGAWKLRGRFRWTLSGTPVVNSLEEFFAYFRFLKVFATGDFDVWKTNFCKKGSTDALKRLKAMLEKMMIRRTHKDQLFGRPIIQLPPAKPVKTIELEFSVFERALYKIVRDRFIQRINTWRNGSMLAVSYSNIFVLLMRLRQLTAHMMLIQRTLKDLLQIEDLEKLWTLSNSPEMQNDPITRQQVAGLQAGYRPQEGFDQPLGASASTPQEGSSASASVNVDLASGSQVTTASSDDRHLLSVAEVPSRFNGDISQQFRRCLKAMHDDGQWEKANNRSLCPLCGQQPSNPYVTSCLHIYCFACLNQVAYESMVAGGESATCLECSCRFKKSESYAAQAFNDASKGTPVAQDMSKKRKRNKDSPEEDINWLNIANPVIQSTKTMAAVKQIKEWQAENPDNKILLFSQFRGVLRVFSKICDEEGWGHAQFHGEMTFDARNKAISRFEEDPDCKILLAAMMAGGVGLNLTMANRVILIDLWWNVAMETQAFCRVFRIGQTKDVEVVRLAVKNTIDMDILQMQKRKTLEIDSAMEKKNRVGKLTTEELLRLFAPIEDTNDGDEDCEEEQQGQGGRRSGRNRNSGRSGYAEAGAEESFIMPDDPYVAPDSDVEEGVEGGMGVEEDLA